MKKYIQISLWILATVFVVLVLVFVSRKQNKMLCKSVKIEFKNIISGEQYLDKNYINNLIGSDSIIGKKISKVDMSKLELKLNNDAYIERAEVYKKINGTLNIEIIQRMPVARIINKYNIGYYVGKEGVLMPISKKLNKRVIVANGNISYSPDFDTIVNIYSKKYDKDSSINVLRNVHTLVEFVNNNKFWNAQIQQIFINDKQEIELIPLVGNHIIKFGTIDSYEEKFKKLQIMYRKGFSSLGWNEYKTVNLKYNKQVVCGKSS